MSVGCSSSRHGLAKDPEAPTQTLKIQGILDHVDSGESSIRVVFTDGRAQVFNSKVRTQLQPGKDYTFNYISEKVLSIPCCLYDITLTSYEVDGQTIQVEWNATQKNLWSI